MKLILTSSDYHSLRHCLCTYDGDVPLEKVIIYSFSHRYYCVLDNIHIFDFGCTTGVDIISPFTEIEFHEKN